VSQFSLVKIPTLRIPTPTEISIQISKIALAMNDLLMTERDANNHDEHVCAQRFSPDIALTKSSVTITRRLAFLLVGRAKIHRSDCKECDPIACTSDLQYSGPVCNYLVRSDAGPISATARCLEFPPAHPTARVFVTFAHPRVERLRLLPFSAIIVTGKSKVTFSFDSDHLLVSAHVHVGTGTILAGLPIFTPGAQDKSMAEWVAAVALCRHWHPHVCETATVFVDRVLTSAPIQAFIRGFSVSTLTNNRRLRYRTQCSAQRLHAATNITEALLCPGFLEFDAADAPCFITEQTDPVLAMVIADSAYYGLWYASMGISITNKSKPATNLQAFLFDTPFEYQRKTTYEWIVSDHKISRRQIMQRRLQQGATVTTKLPDLILSVVQFPTLTRPTVRSLLQQRRIPTLHLPPECKTNTCSATLSCNHRPHRLQVAQETEAVMLASQGADRWEGVQDVWVVGILFHSLFAGTGGLLVRDDYAQVDTNTACLRSCVHSVVSPGIVACYRMAYRLAVCSFELDCEKGTTFDQCAVGPDTELFVDHDRILQCISTIDTTHIAPPKRRVFPNLMFGHQNARKTRHVYPCLEPK
jgi:hypothetical protein